MSSNYMGTKYSWGVNTNRTFVRGSTYRDLK